MTLKLIIQNVTGLEIEFLGDKNDLDEAKKFLAKTCVLQTGNSIDWEIMDYPKPYPNIQMSTYNLFSDIQNQTAVKAILKWIDDNNFTISLRNRYLLQYWDYEMKMIRDDHSKHKSMNNYSSRFLSSPILLNAILNECEKEKYLPEPSELFHFLENSEKLKKDYLNRWIYFSKPYTFDLEEIKQFIKKIDNNNDKIYGKSELVFFSNQFTRIYEDYAPKQQQMCKVK